MLEEAEHIIIIPRLGRWAAIEMDVKYRMYIYFYASDREGERDSM